MKIYKVDFQLLNFLFVKRNTDKTTAICQHRCSTNVTKYVKFY